MENQKKNMNKCLLIAIASMVMLTGVAAVGFHPVTPTSAEASANLYPSTGFEDMLETGETSYALASGARHGIGQVGDLVSVEQETVGTTKNTYLKMTYGGGTNAFANTFALWKGGNLTVAATYTISMDIRKETGFTTTDNFSFRFWTDSATLKDGPALAEKVNAAEVGKWTTITATYELSAEQAAVGSDSLQIWFHAQDGTTANSLDLDNLVVTRPANLGENIFPDETFETVLGTADTEYNYNTSGVKNGVGSNEANVKALKETVDGKSNTYLQLSNGGGSDEFTSIFGFFPFKPSEVKTYNISLDIRKETGFTTTDNLGYRFWTDQATMHDSDPLADKVNAAEIGKWTTLTSTYEFNADQAAVGSDSFQLWFHTVSGTAHNVLDIDNIKITAVVAEALAPALTGSANGVYHQDASADVAFGLDLKGQDITSVTTGSANTAVAATSYAYDATAKSFTFKKDYLATLDVGKNTFTIATAKGSVTVFIQVYPAKGTIPSSTDGYTLTETLLGGDFESYTIGTTFSETQTAEAWGSVSLDDPAVIADDGTGNHAAVLGRKSGSTKTYASAFCILSPDIQKGDVITFKFDYKDAFADASKNTGTDTNVTFVGASNTSYHQIALEGSKPAETFEGNNDEPSWEPVYSTLANGYTHVEMNFVVDFAMLQSTNSVRFLLKIMNDADKLYFDNVHLVRWVKAGETNDTPTITPDKATFDGANPADLAFTVDLKDYSLSAVKLDGHALTKTSYALDGNTLTLKKEYLATLADGDHVFTLASLGGDTTFTVTVTNHAKVAETTKSNALPVWAIVLIVLGSFIALGAAVFFILRAVKKHKKA